MHSIVFNLFASSRDNALGTATSLRAGRPTEELCFHSRQSNFFSSPTRPDRSPPPPDAMDTRAAGGKMSTHRHLVPKLRMSDAIPPLPHTPSPHTYGQLHITYCRPRNCCTFCVLHRHPAVGTVTKLRDERPRNRCSIPDMDTNFCFLHSLQIWSAIRPGC
jgi:hypothetical protein